MTTLRKISSVADVLEREVAPTIKEWLRRVNLIPELTEIKLSDMDRTGHLSKLYADLIVRLRLAKRRHAAHLHRRCQARKSAACAGLLCLRAY